MLKLLTCQEVAAMFGVSVRTLQRHGHDTKIPHAVIGRSKVYQPRDVEEYIESLTKRREPKRKKVRPYVCKHI